MNWKEGELEGEKVCTYVHVRHAQTVQCLAVINRDDLGGLC